MVTSNDAVHLLQCGGEYVTGLLSTNVIPRIAAHVDSDSFIADYQNLTASLNIEEYVKVEHGIV